LQGVLSGFWSPTKIDANEYRRPQKPLRTLIINMTAPTISRIWECKIIMEKCDILINE
jgi:hypothetical protein